MHVMTRRIGKKVKVGSDIRVTVLVIYKKAIKVRVQEPIFILTVTLLLFSHYSHYKTKYTLNDNLWTILTHYKA